MDMRGAITAEDLEASFHTDTDVSTDEGTEARPAGLPQPGRRPPGFDRGPMARPGRPAPLISAPDVWRSAPLSPPIPRPLSVSARRPRAAPWSRPGSPPGGPHVAARAGADARSGPGSDAQSGDAESLAQLPGPKIPC